MREAGAVKELLVTVFDVTQKVRLERELAATQEAARSDVEDLLDVLEHEPARCRTSCWARASAWPT